MKSTGNYCLGVADAAQVLFPRSRVDTDAHLSEKLRPLWIHDGTTRFPIHKASPSATHYEFLRSDRESCLKRGIEVRCRISDLLRAEGRLDETHCDGESLARVLKTAMERACESRVSHFVSPGIVEAPNETLEGEYAKRNFPQVLLSNFIPSYLKVTFVDSTRTWRLEIVDIKSTQPRALPLAKSEFEKKVSSVFTSVRSLSCGRKLTRIHSPRQLFDNERFKLETYRYFVRLIVSKLVQEDPFFRRLVVSRTLVVWRYAGCYSDKCHYRNPRCFLNDNHHLSVEQLEEELQVLRKCDTAWVQRILFDRVPRELGLKKELSSTSGSDSGYSS
ncbi:hypothetical protein JCM3765_000469 [Sporobolomyces pararoseus]